MKTHLKILFTLFFVLEAAAVVLVIIGNTYPTDAWWRQSSAALAALIAGLVTLSYILHGIGEVGDYLFPLLCFALALFGWVCMLHGLKEIGFGLSFTALIVGIPTVLDARRRLASN